MANNLRRVLTGYGGSPVFADHPALPRSGDPVRLGKLVGIALTDEQFGYQAGGTRELSAFHMSEPRDPVNGNNYEDGAVAVSFQMNEWRVPIHNLGGTAAKPGTPVYYHDDDPTGITTTARLFCLESSSQKANRTARAGYLVTEIAANTQEDEAGLLLLSGEDNFEIT